MYTAKREELTIQLNKFLIKARSLKQNDDIFEQQQNFICFLKKNDVLWSEFCKHIYVSEETTVMLSKIFKKCNDLLYIICLQMGLEPTSASVSNISVINSDLLFIASHEYEKHYDPESIKSLEECEDVFDYYEGLLVTLITIFYNTKPVDYECGNLNITMQEPFFKKQIISNEKSKKILGTYNIQEYKSLCISLLNRIDKQIKILYNIYLFRQFQNKDTLGLQDRYFAFAAYCGTIKYFKNFLKDTFSSEPTFEYIIANFKSKHLSGKNKLITVLDYVVSGLHNKEIAKKAGVVQKTVENQINCISNALRSEFDFDDKMQIRDMIEELKENPQKYTQKN